MIVVLYPSGEVSFTQYRMEILPINTVSEMVSLLSIRYNHLDPLLLEAVLEGKILEEGMRLVDAGVRDETKVEIRPRTKRWWCCTIL